MTRRPPAEEPSLFDVVEPDGTRTPGIFRAATPTRAPRRGKTPTPLIAPDELAAITADVSRRWAERIAAARARIEHPEEPPDA